MFKFAIISMSMPTLYESARLRAGKHYGIHNYQLIWTDLWTVHLHLHYIRALLKLANRMSPCTTLPCWSTALLLWFSCACSATSACTSWCQGVEKYKCPAGQSAAALQNVLLHERPGNQEWKRIVNLTSSHQSPPAHSALLQLTHSTPASNSYISDPVIKNCKTVKLDVILTPAPTHTNPLIILSFSLAEKMLRNSMELT